MQYLPKNEQLFSAENGRLSRTQRIAAHLAHRRLQQLYSKLRVARSLRERSPRTVSLLSYKSTRLTNVFYKGECARPFALI